MKLTSRKFAHEGAIPSQFTCDGQDTSPPLDWTDVPAGTKSLCLVLDDPDAPDPRAPKTTWVHWLLYNIPPTATGLPRWFASAGRAFSTSAGSASAAPASARSTTPRRSGPAAC